MAAAWFSWSCCQFTLIFLLTSLSATNTKMDKKDTILTNDGSVFLGLHLNCKVFHGRNNGLTRYSCGDYWPPCLQARAGLLVAKLGLVALSLVLLSGDVSINPSPYPNLNLPNDTGSTSVSFLFVSTDSVHDEASLSFDYGNSSTEPNFILSDADSDCEYCDSSPYFDIGLGTKGLRFGTWNV